jgi:hypothetical protein
MEKTQSGKWYQVLFFCEVSGTPSITHGQHPRQSLCIKLLLLGRKAKQDDRPGDQIRLRKAAKEMPF